MYYSKSVFYTYIVITCCIVTSHAGKSGKNTSSNNNLHKVSLKEHLQKVGQQLKKLPVTAQAYHASLKNYPDDEFETALHNFKRACIILSLEQENKRIISKSMERISILLEYIYSYTKTQDIKPNTCVHINFTKEQITAEFTHLGIHNFTESRYAVAYYSGLIHLLESYRYFPGAPVTALLHESIESMKHCLIPLTSGHLLEHIHNHTEYFLSLLDLLSQEYYYFSEKTILELTRLLEAHKKLAFICYIINTFKMPTITNTQ